MAVQQRFKQVFGTGRLLAVPNGGSVQQPYADLYDIEVDFKTDLKPIFGEGQYPIAVADGHREIDITAKSWSLDLESLATDFNIAAPASGTDSYIFDEKVTIVAHTYTLANAPDTSSGASTVQLTMYVTNGGITFPVLYEQVASGHEVAGVSFSLSGSTITLATGDTATSGKVSYLYANTNGTMVVIVNNYQNSSPIYTLDLFKRDRSPIDNSVGVLWLHLQAVRFGGTKFPIKENEWASWDRTFKAYADPTGTVGTLTFCNQ